MDSNHAIDVDTDSELTTLHTGDTPTLDDGEHRDIMALDAAQEAHDHAEFDLIVARMPSNHRLKVNGIQYIIYDPYRPKKSKRTSWYWNLTQAVELIQTTKGTY